jgi:hypothetical protein
VTEGKGRKDKEEGKLHECGANSLNGCCYSAENLVSSRLTSKYLRIKYSFIHQWLCSPSKDFGRLTQDVSLSVYTLGRTPFDER